MDDERRVAAVTVGAPPALGPAVQYDLADHLGSSVVMTDETGKIIVREDFSAYGETTFGGAAAKRHRFTGRVRDDESGLAYHGRRLYAPWLCRWLSADPLALTGTLEGDDLKRAGSLHSYAACRPLSMVDVTGLQPVPAEALIPAAPIAAGPVELVSPTSTVHYIAPVGEFQFKDLFSSDRSATGQGTVVGRVGFATGLQLPAANGKPAVPLGLAVGDITAAARVNITAGRAAFGGHGAVDVYPSGMELGPVRLHLNISGSGQTSVYSPFRLNAWRENLNHSLLDVQAHFRLDGSFNVGNLRLASVAGSGDYAGGQLNASGTFSAPIARGQWSYGHAGWLRRFGSRMGADQSGRP